MNRLYIYNTISGKKREVQTIQEDMWVCMYVDQQFTEIHILEMQEHI